VIGGRIGVGLAQPQRYVARGPRAEALERGQRRDQIVEADAAIQPNRIVEDCLGEGANGRCPRGGEAEALKVRGGERRGRREGVREAELGETGHRRAEAGDEPARDRVRAAQR
jgi:hypothetical protein